MLIHNAFYRSNEQFHVRFKEGERKEESYYLYYMFREDGIWLCKTTDQEDLTLTDFLGSIDLAEVVFDPDHSEPMDEKKELVYQSGKYEIRQETVYCNWKNKHLDDKEGRNWYFRIRSAELLSTDFEEVQLRLKPVKEAEEI